MKFARLRRAGNLGTAQTGTVAAAVRYLAKGIMTGMLADFSQHSLDIARGQRLRTVRCRREGRIFRRAHGCPTIGQLDLTHGPGLPLTDSGQLGS